MVNLNSQIEEIPFHEFYVMLSEKKELEKLIGKIIVCIGVVEKIGNKIIVLRNFENNLEKLFIVFQEEKEFFKDLINKISRVFLKIKIEDNEPVLILQAIKKLDNFNSEIYMKLLKKEKELFGEL